MLFAVGFVSTFISGGLTGIYLGNSALDIQLHDTYFVIAHFHLVMGVSAVFGMFAAIYHWFPKLFGRYMNPFLGYVHFLSFAAQLVFVINFFVSIFRGERVADRNPWHANTLEWTTPIVPGHGNWPGEIPTVYRGPYEYSKDGRDFNPQDEPLPPAVIEAPAPPVRQG